jgi:poly(3-hydroxybutyrate) depolymerase
VNGHVLPPLLLIHGDMDGVVSPANAQLSVDLWLALLSADTTVRESTGEVRRASRLTYTRRDWRADKRLYVREMRIHGLTHAWSGGAPEHAFSAPRGPDALRLAWTFFAATMET